MTELNPKEHCNAIILRSVKELEAPLRIEKPKKEDKGVNSKEQAEETPKAQQVLPENSSPAKVPFPSAFKNAIWTDSSQSSWMFLRNFT